MEISNLEHIDFDTLYAAFNRAFADYEIHFEKEEIRSMLRRRGYEPGLSFAAFDRGEIVAFTLNGIGEYNGISTAYDTGTGTIKEYRGQGIAGKIFSHSLPYLKEAGIKQYLLEVLQTNSKAIAVYRRMNFETMGELDCFRQTIAEIVWPKFGGIDCEIKPVGIDFVRRAQTFCDFTPSWQNSIESLERGDAGLIMLGAVVDGLPVGYCVTDPLTGDISQIAVRQEYRRRGIASRLLREATARMSTDFVKVLNIRSGNHSLPAFLGSRNILPASSQYEMALRL